MMRRTIWEKALAAFLAVSMMTLTSCGAQESGSASSEASGDQLERIQQAGEIVIATEGTGRPGPSTTRTTSWSATTSRWAS